MRNKALSILIIVVILAVALVAAYPFFARWHAGRMQTQALCEYFEAVQRCPAGDIDTEYQNALSYNNLLANQQSSRQETYRYDDPLAMGETALPPHYETQLTLPDAQDVIAVLELPSLNITLPIYHGVTEEVLRRGVGHLPQSSLPIGSDGSNVILAGQRGMREALLFTHLDDMMLGDLFYIKVLDQTLTYEVDQIRVVEPSDIAVATPESGMDRVTLTTGTPRGVDSHRLLVSGQRVPYIAEPRSWPNANTRQFMIGMEILTLCGAVLWYWWWVQKRRKEDAQIASSIIVHNAPYARSILAIF